MVRSFLPLTCASMPNIRMASHSTRVCFALSKSAFGIKNVKFWLPKS